MDEGRFLDSVLFDSGSEDDRVSLMVQQQALDPSKNSTEEKRISVVTAEEQMAVESQSEIEVMGSLEDVWLLLKASLD